MNYIVLDLEMCKVSRQCSRFRYQTEIIQIGAVRMNDAYEIVDEFREFVKPEFGRLDWFIENLTGISERDLKQADTIQSVLDKFLDWAGTEDVRFMAWSDSDRNQFVKETKLKNMESDRLTLFLDEEKWIDYQQVFGRRYAFDRAVKLSDALMMANVDTEGYSHDGFYDAYNTASLIALLETTPDYKLNYEILRTEEEAAPIGTSLGDLFAGFNFQFAC